MNPENTRSIAALILGLLLAALTWAATAQTNVITNGTFDRDSNADGLGDGWDVGVFTNKTDIVDGMQHVASSQQGCSQAMIEQVIHAPSDGRTWRLDFDISSDTAVYVIVWTLPHSGHCIAILPPDEYRHYSLSFTEDYLEIWGICFYTAGLLPAWINLDNVELYDLTAVGLPDLSRPDSTPEYYDMMGRKLPGRPERGFYIERKGQTDRTMYRIK